MKPDTARSADGPLGPLSLACGSPKLSASFAGGLRRLERGAETPCEGADDPKQPEGGGAAGAAAAADAFLSPWPLPANGIAAEAIEAPKRQPPPKPPPKPPTAAAAGGEESKPPPKDWKAAGAGAPKSPPGLQRNPPEAVRAGSNDARVGSSGCFSFVTGGRCFVLVRPRAAVEPEIEGIFQAKERSSSSLCFSRLERLEVFTAKPSLATLPKASSQ
mmetsp:Transcript_40045/g.87447  ORF Transcript_40045/g.87447 Transcript_40045/m.87447 type:complete len:217 (-) Transcript_40045:2322-2972(-)